MKLRYRSACRAAGLAALLGLVACDSGASDAKKPDPAAEKAAADKAAADKAAADKAAADAKAAEEAKAAAEAKAAEEAKAAAEAKAAEEAKAAADARLAGIDGKKLYDAKCKSCHAADGKGTTAMKKLKAPDMSDPAWQGRHDQAKIAAAIADGVPDSKMKPFKDKLKPEEIEAIAVYVKTLK